jgi:hypothetical protein
MIVHVDDAVCVSSALVQVRLYAMTEADALGTAWSVGLLPTLICYTTLTFCLLQGLAPTQR